MKFRIIQRHNPQDSEAAKKWYAIPVKSGIFKIKDFAKAISGRASLTSGDVHSVLDNFVDELPTFLKLGMSVQLGDFGTMRLSLSSEGTDTKEEFNATKIKNVKVIFTPGIALKRAIDEITLEESK